MDSSDDIMCDMCGFHVRILLLDSCCKTNQGMHIPTLNSSRQDLRQHSINKTAVRLIGNETGVDTGTGFETVKPLTEQGVQVSP